MKYLILAGLVTAGLAIPAWASPVHQVQITHQGQTMDVSYRPVVETRLRPSGLGPRTVNRCFWKSDVTIERTVTASDNVPVAALTRSARTDAAARGMRIGSCGAAATQEAASLGGDPDKLQALLVRQAERDHAQVLADLASISRLQMADAE
jgi:hypothetical protein